jgi:hypothetical protein
MPNQYARPGAWLFRVAVTSRTNASEVMAAQLTARFSQLAMIRLPRTLVTVYKFFYNSIHCM